MKKKTVKSKVPHYNQMLIPVIQALQSLGGSANIDELDVKAKEIMGLPDDICDIMHGENGTRTEVEYQLAWARTNLKNRRILVNSSRGIWSFADSADRDINLILSDDLALKTLSTPKVGSKKMEVTDSIVNDDGELPDEILNWREKLKEVLFRMSPDSFERLTLRMLRESGFVQVEVTGKSKDQGLDGKGIIRLNGIMSFHIIFQCKRYRGSVGSAEIRNFRGAMQGRTDKGLFITTGTFTTEAKKEATRDGAPMIDLIDGDGLVDKLCELSLGVTEKIVKNHEVHEDWFMKL